MMHLKTKIHALPYNKHPKNWGNGAIGGAKIGIVTKDGQPASKPVYLFDAESMQQLQATYSNKDGHYLFRNLNPDRRYLVMVRDDEKRYRPYAWDWVPPDTSLTPAEQLALAKEWYW